MFSALKFRRYYNSYKEGFETVHNHGRVDGLSWGNKQPLKSQWLKTAVVYHLLTLHVQRRSEGGSAHYSPSRIRAEGGITWT